MTPWLALLRKELIQLFSAPVAYLTLAMVGVITALIFFDHLRAYNQILFLYTSNAMGGFEIGSLPNHVSVRDQVFLPVLEQVGLALVGLVPLVTMRVFAEERAQGTIELLLTSQLSSHQIVSGKFAASFLFVALLLATAFVYPASAVLRAGLGTGLLLSVYLGLLAFGLALAAIGLLCSACTTSQLVAAVSAYTVAFILYDFGWATAFTSEAVARVLEAFSLQPRLAAFAEGRAALADLAYFGGIILVAGTLTKTALDGLRLR